MRWWGGRVGRRRGKAVEWYERRRAGGRNSGTSKTRGQKRTKEEKAEKKIKIIKRID